MADSIEKMRKLVKARMTELDDLENYKNHPADEEARLQHTMDQLHLDWRSDKKGKNDDEEVVYLYISSAVRDRRLWPSPGQYRVYLDSEINNVVECSLVQASFPLTDPTVNSSNHKIRFSFAPFNNPTTIEVPIGSYKAEDLAVEITRQLNQTLFAAQIPALYKIEDKTGFAVETATGNMPAGVEQFRVKVVKPLRRFVFQLVDDQEMPVNTPFALHVQPLPESNQMPWRHFNDDLYSLLGYDRNLVQQQGTFDPGSNTYYLLNTTNSQYFGPAADVDQRFAFSVYGNQFADLRGNWVIVLDIDPLNDNDIAYIEEGPDKRFQVGNCLGFVLAKDPAHNNDGMLEINTTGYPIKKSYRDGRSRINQLNVTLRRPDGTIYNFGGLDHFMALKLVVKRTQLDKPVFGR